MATTDSLTTVSLHAPELSVKVHNFLGSFGITDSLLYTLVVSSLICFGLYLFVKQMKVVPSKTQSFFEILYTKLLDMITEILEDREKAIKLFPFIGSLFLVIVINNIFAALPIFGSFTTSDHVHLLRKSTSDFSFTFGISLVAWLAVQWASIRALGGWGFINRFMQVDQFLHQIKHAYQGFSHLKVVSFAAVGSAVGSGLLGITQGLITFFVGFIELFSELLKLFTLSLRLSANMFADELVMIVLLGMFAYIVPSTWLLMGALFGVVQAAVFSILTTVYFKIAMMDHEVH